MIPVTRRRQVTWRPRRGRVTLATVGLVVAVGVPAVASERTTEALDPFGGQGPTVSAAEIAASVTVLEPVVTSLEIPEPRDLREDGAGNGDGSTVTVSSDVLFAFDSADLTSTARGTLAEIAADLGDGTGPVEVVGHTDAVGTEAYNQDLSEARAESVAEALRTGLDDVEVTTAGRSFREPVVEESDDDPSLAARNRRVEINRG